MTYYDSIAKGYTELHKDEQLKKIQLIKDNLVLGKEDLLLDVGCGPYFADFECTVVGIDPSIELLKQTKIPVCQAIAEALPFKDNSFDVIVSITALQNFEDLDKALDEIKRVGKERFVITFLQKAAKKDLFLDKINEYFTVEKIIMEDKDIILFLK
jgi:ubiquinone/menaquinone biosynthesis C-methylase UbiE